jgi:hypothetical protein
LTHHPPDEIVKGNDGEGIMRLPATQPRRPRFGLSRH